MATKNEFDWKETLSFAFKDSSWPQKFLIGVGIAFLSMIIPVLPMLILLGYFYQVLSTVIKTGRIEKLPEWDEWEEKIKGGFRIFIAWLVFLMPSMVLGIGSYIALVGFVILDAAIASQNGTEPGFLFLLGYLLFFLGFGIAVVLGLMGSFFAPPALAHVAHRDSIKGLFEVGLWWRSLRKNFWGYALAFLITFGLLYVVMFAIQAIYMTLVLICLLPILLFMLNFYWGVVASAVFGRAYYESLPLEE